MAQNRTRAVAPENLSDSQLKAYLQKYRQVIPETRQELINSVRAHLRRSGRDCVYVAEPEPALQSVISALTSLFRRESQTDHLSETHYDIPPSQGTFYDHVENQHDQVRNVNVRPSNQKPKPGVIFRENLRENFSPIEPVGQNTVVPTLSRISPDSLDFPPPPALNSETAQFDSTRNYPNHNDSFEISEPEEVRRVKFRDHEYADPDTFRNVEFNEPSRNFPEQLNRNLSSPEFSHKPSKQVKIQQTPEEKFLPPIRSQRDTISNQNPHAVINQISTNSAQALRSKFSYKFDESVHDINDFISCVERHGRQFNLTNSDLCYLACANFKNMEMSTLVLDSINSEDQSNWDLVKATLISQFGKSRRDWWSEFEKRKRKANESTHQLLASLTLLLKKATGSERISEDQKFEIVRKFKQAVNPTLLGHLEALNDISYETIAKDANRLENAFRIPRVPSARIQAVTFPEVQKPEEPVQASASAKKPFQKGNFRKNLHCHLCGKDSHDVRNCFFNPLSPRFKGIDWVRGQSKN